MKSSPTLTLYLTIASILGISILLPRNGLADVTKANNSTALTNTLSWVSGTVPGAGDVAVFDSTLDLHSFANLANPAPLGGNLSLLGIRVAGPILGQADGENGICITNASSANTLTLGTAGIDLSATNAVPLDIESKITLSGSQTWNISDASSRVTNPPPTLPLPATQAHGDRYTVFLINQDEDLCFYALAAGASFELGGFTLTLTNSGTTVIDSGYTVDNGVINVTQGTLAIQGGQSRQTTINSNVTINVAGGATLRLQTTSGAIMSSATINLADGSLLNLAVAGTQGTGIVSNSIAVSGNATLSQTQNPIVGGNNNITNIVAANITGDPDATLNLVPSQSGTGTCVLQLSGDNSGFDGDININALTGIRPVRLSTATAGSANAAWTVSASNILQVAGVAVALGGLNGSGTISNSVASSTATINVGGGDFSGTIANAGTAVMALNKMSASTLALEGTNTYTGPTAVSNGTLLVNGSLAGKVTAYSGGTVGGTGTIRSNLIANAGATVAPGGTGSIGTLTVSGTVTNGGTILMKLNRSNAQTSDQLSCAKTITITAGGALTVTNTGTAPQVGDSFKLFSTTSYSGLLGLLGSASLPSLQAGLAWNILGLTNNGTISVVAQPTVFVSPASTNIFYGNNVTLTATTNGAGPLAIQWYDNNALQIPNATNATLTLTGPGVLASGNYAVVVTSPFGSATNIALVTIAPANLIITAQPQAINYGLSVPATTVTYAGLVNGDTADSLTTQPTISSAQSGVVAAGTYTDNYTASGATDPNYSISYVAGSLTVHQASLTITAQPQTIIYSASVPSTTVTYAGFVNGDTADSLTIQPTISSAQSGVVAAGTYPGNYTASGAVDPNYTISYLPGDLTVAQGSLTITAQPQTIIYGTSVPSTTVTYAGFVNGDTADSLTTQPTVASAQSGIVAVGTYPDNYIASGAVDDNYAITYNSAALTVNPLAVIITGTRTYDGTDIATNSILSVTNAVGGDDVSVASGSGTLTNANVGTNAIISFGTLALGGATATNYSLVDASGSVTVTPAALLITVQPQTITYGASVPETTATYDGFVNGETNTELSTQPTISSAQSGVAAAGTYPGNYTASGAVDPNYTINYLSGDLTVGQASLTITAQPQAITYGMSVPATTVTCDGFVNGDTADSLTTQPSVVSAQSGTVPVGTYPGNYTASGALDPNYSISYLPGTLTVNPAPQPRVVGISVSNGRAIITMAGTNGVTYVTEYTTNLTVNAWIPISTNTPGIDGGWTVTNSIVNEPQKFYRTLIP